MGWNHQLDFCTGINYSPSQSANKNNSQVVFPLNDPTSIVATQKDSRKQSY